MRNTHINCAALTSRLNALVDLEILGRDAPPAKQPQYRSTQAGCELARPLSEMREWGEEWLFGAQGSQLDQSMP